MKKIIATTFVYFDFLTTSHEEKNPLKKNIRANYRKPNTKKYVYI